MDFDKPALRQFHQQMCTTHKCNTLFTNCAKLLAYLEYHLSNKNHILIQNRLMLLSLRPTKLISIKAPLRSKIDFSRERLKHRNRWSLAISDWCDDKKLSGLCLFSDNIRNEILLRHNSTCPWLFEIRVLLLIFKLERL